MRMFYLAPSGQKLVGVIWVWCKDCPHHEAQHLFGQDYIFLNNIIHFSTGLHNSCQYYIFLPGRQGVLHQVWQVSLRTCFLWLPPPSRWLTGSISENIGTENTESGLHGAYSLLRPCKHRFAFLPATFLLHFSLAPNCKQRLKSWFENTHVALNHRNGAIETQNSPQLSISWPYKSNSIEF